MDLFRRRNCTLEARKDRRNYQCRPVKMILVVRDPVDRLISDFTQIAAKRADNNQQQLDFEQQVFDQNGGLNESYPGVKTSMYNYHLKKWHAYGKGNSQTFAPTVIGQDWESRVNPSVSSLEYTVPVVNRFNLWYSFLILAIKGYQCTGVKDFLIRRYPCKDRISYSLPMVLNWSWLLGWPFKNSKIFSVWTKSSQKITLFEAKEATTVSIRAIQWLPDAWRNQKAVLMLKYLKA